MLGFTTPGATIPINSDASTGTPIQNPLDAATKARVLKTYAKLPIICEANQGQTDKQVKFLARMSQVITSLTRLTWGQQL